MPVLPQCLYYPVPVAAIIARAKNPQQQRRLRITPVDVMQAQTLRNERVRRRTVYVLGHASSPEDYSRARLPQIAPQEENRRRSKSRFISHV